MLEAKEKKSNFNSSQFHKGTEKRNKLFFNETLIGIFFVIERLI